MEKVFSFMTDEAAKRFADTVVKRDALALIDDKEVVVDCYEEDIDWIEAMYIVFSHSKSNQPSQG